MSIIGLLAIYLRVKHRRDCHGAKIIVGLEDSLVFAHPSYELLMN
jgi:hypothetical protein